MITEEEKELFKETVWDHYTQNKRDNMPWRETTNPYHILVSEIMLQQTQVSRVIEKYNQFTQTFPTVESLAKAPLSQVLTEWQGLGYNRRAKFLKQAAEKIFYEYNNTFPKTVEGLITLPGVGKNTAGAIMAYAYNTAIPYIETNVRTVYIFHFFRDESDVPDHIIEEIVSETMDHEHPREWYWAIMDYGTHLKKTYGNTSRQSKAYQKQSKFEGSRRQKRGAIIRYLTKHTSASLDKLHKETKGSKTLIKEILNDLITEAIIEKTRRSYRLRE